MAVIDNHHIRLRFCSWKSVSSHAIRFFQDGFWASHVETVMPDGKWLGARLNGGVRARDAHYDKIKIEREVFVDIACTPEEAATYHMFMIRQLHKPYDITAILGMMMHHNWRDPNHWFCSELVGAGFCECGKMSRGLASSLKHVTPRDIALLIDSIPRVQGLSV